MLKYVNTGIVFQEVPDEVTLAVNISNCPCRCPGCHSSYLWDDTGLPLDTAAVDDLVKKFTATDVENTPTKEGSNAAPTFTTYGDNDLSFHFLELGNALQ